MSLASLPKTIEPSTSATSLMPPDVHPFWAFFYYYLFYLMGNALEVRWGTVAYNAYLGIGLVANAGVGLAGAAFLPAFFPGTIAIENAFLYSTIFLGFAYLFPDFTLMLFFILPIKIKWLGGYPDNVHYLRQRHTVYSVINVNNIIKAGRKEVMS